MSKGLVVLCKEGMEVFKVAEKNTIIFKEGHRYLLIAQEDGNYVVGKKHTPVKISDKIFKRHFQ